MEIMKKLIYKLWIRFYVFYKPLFNRKKMWKYWKTKSVVRYNDAVNTALFFNMSTLVLLLLYLSTFIFGKTPYHNNGSLRFVLPLIITIIGIPIILQFIDYKLENKTAFYRTVLKSTRKCHKKHVVVYVVATILLFLISIFLLGTRMIFT